MTPPRLDEAFAVFAQRPDARVDIDEWDAHAARFFATRLRLSHDDSAPRPAAGVSTRSVTFVVEPQGEPSGLRAGFARPSGPADHALADAADARAGGTGLALLARRCRMIWLVAREDPGDRIALRLAAILASVLLGPVLDAARGELFGAKTARAKLR